MFSCIRSINGHGVVEIGGDTEIDHVDILSLKDAAVIVIIVRDIKSLCKTLGMLLESGVNLSEALDIVCNIVDNAVLAKQLNQARDKIIKEGKISKYLRETGIFPNIAIYMISTGEQSGKLGEMLTTVGNDYDKELTELTEGLTAKINPIMTVVMGVIIVFIMASIFLPIMSMSDLAGI